VGAASRAVFSTVGVTRALTDVRSRPRPEAPATTVPSADPTSSRAEAEPPVLVSAVGTVCC